VAKKTGKGPAAITQRPSHPEPVDSLYLDPRNPRLAMADVEAEATQEQILKVLWREMAVDEIALSIAANGFFTYEPLFAIEEDGRLVVIEGNRRLAAVKLLRDEELRKKIGATDLPEISQGIHDQLDTLPVIRCSREEVWQFLGFKHVNGPQSWESYSKAQYIAWVHNQVGVPLKEIAKQIGDAHSTVLRLYNGLMTLQQAEEAKVYDPEDRVRRHLNFSHLYTGLKYPGVQAFLGVSPDSIEKQRPVPAKRVKQLGELCVWLFGSKSKNQEPLIHSQNPDLRILDEVLQTERGIDALRQGLPLRVSQEIAQGDERVFREALLAGKQSLQKARGTLLTGYKGRSDLLTTSEEVKQLAEDIYKEMSDRAALKGGSKARSAR
jgi:ParB/Sulfiredoxin domain